MTHIITYNVYSHQPVSQSLKTFRLKLVTELIGTYTHRSMLEGQVGLPLNYYHQHFLAQITFQQEVINLGGASTEGKNNMCPTNGELAYVSTMPVQRIHICA